jgi:hypothetical protein
MWHSAAAQAAQSWCICTQSWYICTQWAQCTAGCDENSSFCVQSDTVKAHHVCADNDCHHAAAATCFVRQSDGLLAQSCYSCCVVIYCHEREAGITVSPALAAAAA